MLSQKSSKDKRKSLPKQGQSTEAFHLRSNPSRQEEVLQVLCFQRIFHGAGLLSRPKSLKFQEECASIVGMKSPLFWKSCSVVVAIAFSVAGFFWVMKPQRISMQDIPLPMPRYVASAATTARVQTPPHHSKSKNAAKKAKAESLNK